MRVKVLYESCGVAENNINVAIKELRDHGYKVIEIQTQASAKADWMYITLIYKKIRRMP